MLIPLQPQLQPVSSSHVRPGGFRHWVSPSVLFKCVPPVARVQKARLVLQMGPEKAGG